MLLLLIHCRLLLVLIRICLMLVILLIFLSLHPSRFPDLARLYLQQIAVDWLSKLLAAYFLHILCKLDWAVFLLVWLFDVFMFYHQTLFKCLSLFCLHIFLVATFWPFRFQMYALFQNNELLFCWVWFQTWQEIVFDFEFSILIDWNCAYRIVGFLFLRLWGVDLKLIIIRLIRVMTVKWSTKSCWYKLWSLRSDDTISTDAESHLLEILLLFEIHGRHPELTVRVIILRFQMEIVMFLEFPLIIHRIIFVLSIDVLCLKINLLFFGFLILALLCICGGLIRVSQMCAE